MAPSVRPLEPGALPGRAGWQAAVGGALPRPGTELWHLPRVGSGWHLGPSWPLGVGFWGAGAFWGDMAVPSAVPVGHSGTRPRASLSVTERPRAQPHPVLAACGCRPKWPRGSRWKEPEFVLTVLGSDPEQGGSGAVLPPEAPGEDPSSSQGPGLVTASPQPLLLWSHGISSSSTSCRDPRVTTWVTQRGRLPASSAHTPAARFQQRDGPPVPGVGAPFTHCLLPSGQQMG